MRPETPTRRPATRTFTVDTAPPRPRSTPAPRADQRRHALLHLLLRARGELRVPPRLHPGGRLRALHLAEALQLPRRRRPHLRGPGHRRGRQHRPTPASRSFTVDTVAPQTQIDSGPSGRPTTPRRRFAFSSEPGASFECRLDSNQEADFAPCSSPQALQLPRRRRPHLRGPGDRPGRQPDPTPASRSFTVDTAAPQTQIDSGPSGLTNDASPDASPSPPSRGRASSAASTRAWRRDFAPCSSPQPYSSLADGAHTFEVRAIDAAGNADPSPGLAQLHRRHRRPPDPDRLRPLGPDQRRLARLRLLLARPGRASSAASTRPAADFAPCTSPQPYSSLADGAHTFEVRATDAAGNTDPTPASRSFTVDTAPPRPRSTPAPRA